MLKFSPKWVTLKVKQDLDKRLWASSITAVQRKICSVVLMVSQVNPRNVETYFYRSASVVSHVDEEPGILFSVRWAEWFNSISRAKYNTDHWCTECFHMNITNELCHRLYSRKLLLGLIRTWPIVMNYFQDFCETRICSNLFLKCFCHFLMTFLFSKLILNFVTYFYLLLVLATISLAEVTCWDWRGATSLLKNWIVIELFYNPYPFFARYCFTSPTHFLFGRIFL